MPITVFVWLACDNAVWCDLDLTLPFLGTDSDAVPEGSGEAGRIGKTGLDARPRPPYLRRAVGALLLFLVADRSGTGAEQIPISLRKSLAK